MMISIFYGLSGRLHFSALHFFQQMQLFPQRNAFKLEVVFGFGDFLQLFGEVCNIFLNLLDDSGQLLHFSALASHQPNQLVISLEQLLYGHIFLLFLQFQLFGILPNPICNLPFNLVFLMALLKFIKQEQHLFLELGILTPHEEDIGIVYQDGEEWCRIIGSRDLGVVVRTTIVIHWQFFLNSKTHGFPFFLVAFEVLKRFCFLQHLIILRCKQTFVSQERPFLPLRQFLYARLHFYFLYPWSLQAALHRPARTTNKTYIGIWSSLIVFFVVFQNNRQGVLLISTVRTPPLICAYIFFEIVFERLFLEGCWKVGWIRLVFVIGFWRCLKHCFLGIINQISSHLISAMQTLFSSCLEEETWHENNKLDTVSELPFKFKIANSIGLANLIVRHFAQPRKKEKYTFPRTFLRFIFNDNCHIPLLYFPVAYPNLSQILVYCHGSGSNLNNVYQFASEIANRYGIAVLAYDYTGDGESEKQFSSYEEDLRLVLSWVTRQGFALNRTILCGFSLGSYSALLLEGQMPRILISPICGIFSFLNGEARRFENEKYDTVDKAIRLKTKCLVYHCSEEMVHISHGQLIVQALRRDQQPEEVQFHEITDKIYQHRTAPSYLFSREGSKVLADFIASHCKVAKIQLLDDKTKQLQRELFQLIFFQTEIANLAKLQSVTTL